MAKIHLGLVMNSLMFDLYQATTMLLFLLSSTSANRRRHYVAEGRADPAGVTRSARTLPVTFHLSGSR